MTTTTQAYFLQFSGFDPYDLRAEIDAISDELFDAGYGDCSHFLDAHAHHRSEWQSVKSFGCEECGSLNLRGKMFYKMTDGLGPRYRRFAVCNDCGHVMEF